MYINVYSDQIVPLGYFSKCQNQMLKKTLRSRSRLARVPRRAAAALQIGAHHRVRGADRRPALPGIQLAAHHAPHLAAQSPRQERPHRPAAAHHWQHPRREQLPGAGARRRQRHRHGKVSCP